MTFARVAVWPLGGFLLMLVLVQVGATQALDTAITDIVRFPMDCRLAAFSNIANLLFSAESGVAMCGVASLVLLRAGYGRYSLVPWLMFVSLVVEVGAKVLIERPSPPEPTWPALAGCPLSYPLLKASLPYSFPSGHSIRMAYFGVVLIALYRGRAGEMVLRWLVGVVVLILAWERVYLDGHWPSDVVGGLLLGTALALISLDVLARSSRSERRRRLVSAAQRSDAGAQAHSKG